MRPLAGSSFREESFSGNLPEKNKHIRVTLVRRLFLMSAQRSKYARTRKGEAPFLSPLSARQEKMKKTKRNGSGTVARKFRKKKREKSFSSPGARGNAPPAHKVTIPFVEHLYEESVWTAKMF
jgi:hypothetical protein